MDDIPIFTDHCTPHIDLIIHLRGENSRLHEEIKELELELQITRTQNEKLIDTSFSPQSVDSVANVSYDFLQVSQELSRCKETLKGGFHLPFHKLIYVILNIVMKYYLS